MGLLRVIATVILITGCHNGVENKYHATAATLGSTESLTTSGTQLTSETSGGVTDLVSNAQSTQGSTRRPDLPTADSEPTATQSHTPLTGASEGAPNTATSGRATDITTSEGPTPATGGPLTEETSVAIETTSSGAVEEGTTADSANDCPSQTFGHNCEFECRCLNSSESCSTTTGHCVSGCPGDYFGPGCLISTEDGPVAIVVVLACMLSLALLIIVVLIYYVTIHMPTKSRKKELFKRAQAATYDFHEMAKRKSLIPAFELRKSVPRISELDIQVMSDLLGDGRFGKIMRGYHKQNDTSVEVAFKTIRDGSTEEDVDEFICQLEIYSAVEAHPNVIHFYGVCAVGDQMFAAFEFVPHGNLRNFLRNSAIRVPENGSGSQSELQHLTPRRKLLKFAYEISLGMRHLARQQIIHRELSAKSVLVGHNYVCKIGGLNPPGHTRASRWMAPESLTKGEFSVQSDVWSFGIVLWEIMSLGEKPFPQFATKDLGQALLVDCIRPPKPEGCDGDIYGLMQWCWKELCDDRPTFLILSNTLREMIDSGQMRQDLNDSDIE